MNNVSSSKKHRILVPAGEAYYPIKESGRHVFLIASPLPVEIHIGDTTENEFLPGQGVSFDKPEIFERVEIRHKGTSAIWVEIWIGMVAFVDNRRDNMESPTEAIGLPFDEIAADSVIDLVPGITRQRIRRKAIIVSNYDPAVTIYVSDFSNANAGKGNILARVGREESIILPISEPCRLRNDTGAVISCSVGEIYWTR